MTLTVVLFLFLASFQAPAKPFALMVGDPAPPIRVSAFLKGEPVTAFQKGQVYVIDFWATWCGPCRESIPHLTELQKKYGDKLRIVGVSVWEPREKDVEPFVKEWGDRMGYTVASDRVEGITATDDEQRSRESVNKGLMSKSYMVDSGWAEIGIPCVLIINGDGRIAWIGSGAEIRPRWTAILDEVVSGRHDLKAAAVTYQKKMEVERLRPRRKGKGPEKPRRPAISRLPKSIGTTSSALGPDYEHFYHQQVLNAPSSKKGSGRGDRFPFAERGQSRLGDNHEYDGDLGLRRARPRTRTPEGRNRGLPVGALQERPRPPLAAHDHGGHALPARRKRQGRRPCGQGSAHRQG